MAKTKLKTITLEGPGGPISVICPGHVTQKVFNDAFKNEGWSERGNYKQKDLEYVYMRKTKSKGQEFYSRVAPGKPGARKFTWTPWD